ncbi:short-chain alcohol dehydrogenase [Mycolicibacterium chubuense NBB4]|uniref:Short-chain alcohol dehydrogenase n=1 Tax=Mycolicibacterium chubuense (strain NBB4) TaxID=710421 RepID=I4BRR8_MYCCN|nr:SDR family NAD(P)-dependent oxidoreductase [Mycolicibacterium chubuense]AFM19975.1 short-chain alcohol dehydrogenase [Mycolicibacterium chubuense NBB4]
MSPVALVTGAASGIGAAIAGALAEGGWTVAGLDLHPAAAVSHSVVADVSDSAQVADAVASVQRDVGPVEALVTAAGHYAQSAVSDITAEAWQRMLRVHLGGLRNCAHAVLPGMRQRRSGRIVSIASELGIAGGDSEAHYAAAKGAVIGFVRSLAAEVAADGVRVNAVAPGPTDTPLLDADSPWRAPEYLATLPSRRLCRPDEIARTVSFLLDEGDFCVGEVLSPNSGAVI